jgi:hypothetical protein
LTGKAWQMDETSIRVQPVLAQPHGDGSLGELEVLTGQLHAQFLSNQDGAIADYIPELSKVGPDQFGIALGLPNGRIVSAGDRCRRGVENGWRAAAWRAVQHHHPRCQKQPPLQRGAADPLGNVHLRHV